MKKHQIDDLFAKKLAEYRQEPSQKAFEKFQTRLAGQQQKRRGGVFFINRNWSYYAAAAGIVVALTVGVLFLKNNTNESTTLASSEIKPKTEKIIIKNTDSQLVKTNTTTNDIEKNNGILIEKPTLKVAKILPMISNEINVAKTENATKSNEKIVIDDSPEEETSVAINQIVEAPSREITQPIETKSSEVFKNDIGGSIVVVLEPESSENEIISSINADSPTSLEDAKRLGAEKEENAKSFIAKLYGEYKHFKYGEKVDLKKIGVKDVLARVDESLFKEEREDAIGFMQRKLGRLKKENN